MADAGAYRPVRQLPSDASTASMSTVLTQNSEAMSGMTSLASRSVGSASWYSGQQPSGSVSTHGRAQRRAGYHSSDEEEPDVGARTPRRARRGRSGYAPRPGTVQWSVPGVGGTNHVGVGGGAGGAAGQAAVPRNVADADAAAGGGPRRAALHIHRDSPAFAPQSETSESGWDSGSASSPATSRGGRGGRGGRRGRVAAPRRPPGGNDAAWAAQAALANVQVVVDRSPATPGQSADAFRRLQVESVYIAAGSVVVWLTVLYTFPTLGDPCSAAEPVKSWAGLLRYAEAYALNLLLLQLPCAIGPEISFIHVFDKERLGLPEAQQSSSLPWWAVWRVTTLVIPRLVAQVFIKYYFSKAWFGGVLIGANLVLTYALPYLWIRDWKTWWHHHRVALPVMYIYVIMVALCFGVLPRLLTQDVTRTAHYIAGPLIMGAVELVLIGGLTVVLRASGEWDFRNASLWARIVLSMFLGFKLLILTNAKLPQWMLAATAANLLLFETFMQNLDIIGAGVVKCYRRVMRAPMEHSATRSMLRSSFYSVYMASKKEGLVAPLVGQVMMKLVRQNPFPEVVDCSTGEVYEEINMPWLNLFLALLVIVACEVIPVLVHYATSVAGGWHWLYGIKTHIDPPNMWQRGTLYVNQMTVTVFAFAQGLLLVPGGSL